MQILQFLPTGVLRNPLLRDPGITAITLGDMQSRSGKASAWCGWLFSLALPIPHFQQQQCHGYYHEANEREKCSHSQNLHTINSIHFFSLFLFLNLAIARHISFSFPCLPRQAYHRSQYFLAPSPCFLLLQSFYLGVTSKKLIQCFPLSTLLTYYFLQTCFETIKCNS